MTIRKKCAFCPSLRRCAVWKRRTGCLRGSWRSCASRPSCRRRRSRASTKGQRDYYLREQLKVIRGELGENDEDAEIDEYREKIEKLHLPQEADEKLHKELQRLEKQPYGSAEASVIRNYLDVALELPWNTRTRERTDIRIARRILDEDHFGLEKVKERILEILAVRQLAPEQPGQIICLIALRASARRPSP